MASKIDSEKLILGLGLSQESISDEVASKLMKLAADNAKQQAKITKLEARLERAESLADIDPLCPLFNRRAFMRELEREIAIAERHDTELSVLYIDLDQFKRINDSHGHEAGDQVLVAIAKILKASVRRTDIVGRIGGDEFAVVLIRSNTVQTNARVEALASALSGAAEKLHGVNASIGVVAWRRGASASMTLQEADNAMFANKGGLRNG